MIRPIRGRAAEQLNEKLDDALDRLQACKAVATEEAELGEFYASLGDGVRAGAHLHAAAHLRDAIDGPTEKPAVKPSLAS